MKLVSTYLAVMKKLSVFRIGVALLMVLAGCSSDFDFRGEDRPAYDNTVTPDELVALRQQGATVLDVRLLEDFDADPVLIPDAMYRDPDDISSWAGQMSPADGPVVVYCVKGKWVSQKAATFLNDRGFEVYSLEGGIEGWKSGGLETEVP